MKSLIIISILLIACNGVDKSLDDSNKIRTVADNPCNILMQKKSIGRNTLNTKANHLSTKLKKGIVLSKQEDIDVIMIANTAKWGNWDSNISILRSCKDVLLLKEYFDESYLNVLREKYASCGSFSSPVFEELKISYGGKPSVSSRFEFSNNPDDIETVVIKSEIDKNGSEIRM